MNFDQLKKDPIMKRSNSTYITLKPRPNKMHTHTNPQYSMTFKKHRTFKYIVIITVL